MDLAICVIGFNRIFSLKRLLGSLNNAFYDTNVPLIISIDKSDTDVVEKYADSFIWAFGPKRVIKHEENLGLRKHILQCGNLLEEFDALIVLEDDIEVSPGFFCYAKQCVEKYYNDDQIAGISLYNFHVNYLNKLPFTPLKTESDVYLMKCAQSWGQIWMKKQWGEFLNWYRENNEEFHESPHLPLSICKWPKSSWLKYHTRYCIEKNKYFVYPYTSLTTNYSDVGVHSNQSSYLFQVPLLFSCKKDYILEPTIHYDGFFENENILKYLNYNEDEICIDLYGEKSNREKKRYYLTTKLLNYKIISSYGLCLRPIELNVIKEIEGQGIFLYDTYTKANNHFSINCHSIYLYLYNIGYNLIDTIKPNVSFKQYIKNLIRFKLRQLKHFMSVQ